MSRIALKKVVLVCFLVFALLNFYLWRIILDGNELAVTFFDVGQGDAIFIETPQGHQILIDGGPDENILEKLGERLSFWDKSLDAVILTHPDADHITGLVHALEKYQVDAIFWTGVEKDTKVFSEWQGQLGEHSAEGAHIYEVAAGDKIFFGEDVSFEIFSPDESAKKTYATEINDTSIVAKLTYGDDTFLLTGDITRDIERMLVEQEWDVDVDVLKVAHHGSKTSSSPPFVLKTSPKFVVIQVGQDNRFGHPHEEVLDVFSLLNSPVLRTDENGDILIKSNGYTFSE